MTRIRARYTWQMGASTYVGRVGGSAVAFGVGTAVILGGGCGIASADETGSRRWLLGEQRPGVVHGCGEGCEPGQAPDRDRRHRHVVDGWRQHVVAEPAAPLEDGEADDVGRAGFVEWLPRRRRRRRSRSVARRRRRSRRRRRPTGRPTALPVRPASRKHPRASMFRLHPRSPPNATRPGASAPTVDSAGSRPVTRAETTRSAASRSRRRLTTRSWRPWPRLSRLPADLAVVAPAARSAAPTNVVEVVATAVSTFVGSLLTPLAAGTTPEAPATQPQLWTLLAFARRELETAFPPPSSAQGRVGDVTVGEALTAAVPEAVRRRNSRPPLRSPPSRTR